MAEEIRNPVVRIFGQLRRHKEENERVEQFPRNEEDKKTPDHLDRTRQSLDPDADDEEGVLDLAFGKVSH